MVSPLTAPRAHRPPQMRALAHPCGWRLEGCSCRRAADRHRGRRASAIARPRARSTCASSPSTASSRRRLGGVGRRRPWRAGGRRPVAAPSARRPETARAARRLSARLPRSAASRRATRASRRAGDAARVARGPGQTDSCCTSRPDELEAARRGGRRSSAAHLDASPTHPAPPGRPPVRVLVMRSSYRPGEGH